MLLHLWTETVRFWLQLLQNQWFATHLWFPFTKTLWGIDFPHVDITCITGLQSSLVDMIQMYSRIIHTPGTKGLAILFYECWVQEIALEEYEGDQLDLDCPQNKLHPNSSPQERAGYALVKLVKISTCIRCFFAQYLNDITDEGRHPLLQFLWH